MYRRNLKCRSLSSERVGIDRVTNSKSLTTDSQEKDPMHPAESQKPWKQWMKLGVICAVIAAGWAFQSLPLWFYFLPTEHERVAADCLLSKYSNQTFSMSKGSTCQESLQNLMLHKCLPAMPALWILPSQSQGDVKEAVNAVINNHNMSTICEDHMLLFLCQYILRPYDSSGKVYWPSFAECAALCSEIFTREWNQSCEFLELERLGRLTRCELFLKLAVKCEANMNFVDLQSFFASKPGGLHSSESNNSLSQCTIQCQRGFYCTTLEGVFEICKPRCDQWKMESYSTVVARDVCGIVSSIISLVAGILVIVLSCIRWKSMFTFPSVFIVYIAMSFILYDVVYLVTYIDRYSLLCSSVDLEESIDKSTPFCNINGATFTYCLLQIPLWWLFHIASLFWGIHCPLRAQLLQKRGWVKYIHVTTVIIGLLLPAIPVIVIFAAGDGFVIGRFPPGLCVARDGDISFYTTILPFTIMVQAGIFLLTFTAWKIHKHYSLRRSSLSHQHQSQIGRAEIIILIVLCYYVIVSVFNQAYIAWTIKDEEKLNAEMEKYFCCESGGYDPANPCDASKVHTLSHLELLATASMVTGLFPVVMLVFVVHIKDLKKWYRDVCKCFQ